MKKAIVVAFFVLGILALPPDRGGAQERPEGKRTVYVVRHSASGELAKVLGRHFKETELQAIPDSSSNCLLITASPAAFAEVAKLLEQLDRRPATVAVEVTILELTNRKGGDKLAPAEPDVDERELSGVINEVMAKVQLLRKQGRVAGLRSIQLSALENQPASVR